MRSQRKNRAYNNQSEAVALGKKIRSLRIGLKMTQRDLAVEADIDESTVLRIEKARLVITVDLLFTLAKALKVSPAELFEPE